MQRERGAEGEEAVEAGRLPPGGSDQAAALRPAGTLRGRTAEHLANLILSGVFPAGEYLPPEDELTRRLGISRTAYREAICRLEAQGLVEVRHGVGTLVTDRSREAVAGSLLLLLRRRASATADLLEARQILETETAALAAQRVTEEDLAALDAALDAMRRPGTTPEEYTAGDLHFHLALALASHNEVLAALAESLRGALHDAIAATFAIDGRTERRLRDHERILQAVRARDPLAARQAMATHLDATRAALQQLGRLPAPAATPPERGPQSRRASRGREEDGAGTCAEGRAQEAPVPQETGQRLRRQDAKGEPAHGGVGALPGLEQRRRTAGKELNQS